jgi:hypothetical protein
MQDSGPMSKGGDQTIITFVTHDVNYFNFSQSSDPNLIAYSYSGGGSSNFSSNFVKPFTQLLFLAWIILTIIYIKRSKEQFRF